MRVFVAGASGALGRRLVPQLTEAGHEVTGTHCSPAGARLVEALGAEPVRLDLLDAGAVRAAVLSCRPDAIVHQATALAGVRFGRNLDRAFAVTNRLRTEGTDALLAAAREAGVRRFVAQSFAPRSTGETFAALTYLERATLAFGGIALRYGGFYGATSDALIEQVRKRQFPVVGNGGGIFPWVHLDDGAAATVAAVEHRGPAVYNIVDDEPAPVRDWLPVLARSLGAEPPRYLPGWLARLVTGPAVVVLGTQGRGASNIKAKRELGWAPRYGSWRAGFLASYPPVTAGLLPAWPC
jgi:nucleoside-diphosphate-sugar epimerase